MSKDKLWVLGHRIRPIETDGSYGMVEIISPPHVPGPPPHFHKSEREFFLIIKGTLNVMRDETAQWGQLIRTPKQIEDFVANEGAVANRATLGGTHSASNTVTEDQPNVAG